MINSFLVLPILFLSVVFAYYAEIKDSIEYKLTGQNSVTRFDEEVSNTKFLEYKNPDFGISFLYPPGWKITDRPNPDSNRFNSSHYIATHSVVYFVEFHKDYEQELVDLLLNKENSVIGNTNINGIEFKTVTSKYSLEAGFITPYYLISENPRILIEYKSPSEGRFLKSYDKIFDRVIRSTKVI